MTSVQILTIPSAQPVFVPRPGARFQKGLAVNLTEKTTLLLVAGDLALHASAVYAGHALRFGTFPPSEGSAALLPGPGSVLRCGVLFSSYLVELYNSKQLLLQGPAVRDSARADPVPSRCCRSCTTCCRRSRSGGASSRCPLPCSRVMQFPGTGFAPSSRGTGAEGARARDRDGGQEDRFADPVAQSAARAARLLQLRPGERRHPAPGDRGTASAPLSDVVRKGRPQKIVVSLTERRGTLPVRDILSCKLKGVEVVEATSFYEELTGKLLLEDLHPSGLIFSEGFRVTRTIRISKRAFDITAALAGCCSRLPLLPLDRTGHRARVGRPRASSDRSGPARTKALRALSSSGACARTRSRRRARSGPRRTTSG